MAIKRYTATSDNTITNAYKMDMLTRATGSNMGASDILEVFSIYGQQTTSSAELSRVLVKFPTDSISSDRTAGTIPASGSVKFYLRMFNARHSEQLPENFTFNVLAVSASWQEGTGLDMESYKDETKDNIAGSNWKNATSNTANATLVDAINLSGIAAADAFTITVPTRAGGDGVAHQFKFDTGTNIDALSDTTGFGVSTTSITDDGDAASVVVDAINGVANNKYQYGGANLGADSTLAYGTLGVSASIGTSATKVTLTMITAGAAGNITNVLAANTGFEGDLLLESSFTGGDGPWAAVGGDYHSSSYTAGSTMPRYTVDFVEGHEDLELDVTAAVEEWLAGTHSNYGFGIHLTSSFEAYTTGSDSNVLHNSDGVQKSYYTKRFFSRSSEFFFKKPIIEARWDSRKKDQRGDFYYSSSLAPADDNLNTVFLYNYVRGQLRNIPGIDTGKIYVQIFSGSLDNSVPSGRALTLVKDDKHVQGTATTVVSGGWIETGVYTASFALTSAATPLTNLFDVWRSADSDSEASTQYFTGSIKPKSLNSPSWNEYSQYTTKITNLKSKYEKNEKARFRVFTRPRDFSPTIYSVASKDIENAIIPSASFEIIRMVDEHTVINNSTGSSDYHTYLSYDASGSYFDLDMTLLEPGYLYGVKFAYYISADWREQEEVFIFRVEDN